MCGIAGFINPEPRQDAEAMKRDALAMADAITSRGPDDYGAWAEVSAGVAFGHRRLSVIDLSACGRQPMESASGRYVIVYNGEVYNFNVIRKELETGGARPWRGHSDTEVMLAAIEEYGVREATQRFNGMFAFALWDRKERVITLVRDRLGKKPLYYGWNNGVFMFGSELKSFMAHPAFRGEVDRSALALFLRYNYVPAPYCIYKGIYKLEPGGLLRIPFPMKRDETPQPEKYWDAKEIYESGAANPVDAGGEERLGELEDLLLDSVGMRMISDVPLGAFLSGGIDSSLVVALMQAQSSRPVKTFTIGFKEEAYNEAVYAKKVANHLGTDHTELYVTPQEALEVIPDLPALYDEPFSDSSQIPTYLVSKMARRHVTVALSGDGGDESFGGYNRYLWASSIWRKIGWLPAGARKMVSRSLDAVPPSGWDRVYGIVEPIMPKRYRINNPGDKAHKLAEILGGAGPMEMYRWLVSHFKEPEKIVIGSTEPVTALTDKARWARLDDFNQLMMYLDTISYLPDDILVKVDRASMGVSLETRAPLLDYRVVEYAARIPAGQKIRNGAGKAHLRDIVRKYVPDELIERPKMGFAMPIDSWLRGELRDWAESLLNEKRLREEGFFEPAGIRLKWDEHQAGKRNWQYYLWDILMFQQWLETYGGRR